MLDRFGPAAVAAVIIASSALASHAGRADAPAAPTVHVRISNYAFKDPSITVARGTTVVWQNSDDDPHTVTAVDGSFDSHGLGNGDTYSHRFDTSGTFQYYCKVHPFMKGVVIVQGAQP